MRLDYRWFDYESGHAWCESAYKYQIISVVAEFANTITNLPLIMLPLVNVLLIRPYIETVNCGRVRCAIAVVTVVVSAFCFVKPSLNALVLMLWSIPSIVIIHHEAANAGIPEITGFPRKISTLWIAASICWVSDRVFCDFWLLLGTPYFHALFHLLSSLAAYNVFIMFSLIDICRRNDQHQYSYRIKHFPEKGPFRLPYIVLTICCKYL
ncbi:unnamed protein product [Litomosoides sigmodontis]|uniref:Alkaline ceramidase n=1 Tax=Litomosoides sigmodontis TaxID=42156 RepID=A0A3P6SNT4_LITSI|nr:unnamed protein product [Litomosoides sigmodontis]